MTLHRMLWTAALALPLASPALAECEYLTEHFKLCSEGTPFAKGTWEQGGDSATLYLGKIGFEGFEDYLGRDPAKTIGAELDALMAPSGTGKQITHHSRDKLKTETLSIVRSIDTVAIPGTKPELRATMIAVDHQERILLMVTAPADTPLETLDTMSKDYAGLIRPRPAQEN